MKYIIGNWKMYPKTFTEAKALAGGLKRTVGAVRGVTVVLCPPFPYLGAFTGDKKTKWGAQNCATQAEGAMTGEVSPAMLVSMGVKYVILGHSERRMEGETNETINLKVQAALKEGLTVVLCVGEKVREESGEYFNDVRAQLRSALTGLPSKYASHIIVAYEPVWAIGKTATRAAVPEDVCEMSLFIRKDLVHIFGKQTGKAIPVLYGGSVDEKNANAYMTAGGADGLLIGRISLQKDQFTAIAKNAATIK